MALKESNAFIVVALTATPPYDSTQAEVNKYFKLCGEVDDEISVPELIRENDLSPHQDFVYFSQPYDSELNFIKNFRSDIADFKEALTQDEDFISLLETHRFYKNPKLYSDEIYNNTSYFSSILIVLSEVGIPVEHKKLELLGFNEYDNINFPKLDLHWLEILFHNLLVTDRENLETYEDYLKHLEKKLRQLHVFDKNRVNFFGDEWLYKSLALSPSKLESIAEIVSAERFSLKDD